MEIAALQHVAVAMRGALAELLARASSGERSADLSELAQHVRELLEILVEGLAELSADLAPGGARRSGRLPYLYAPTNASFGVVLAVDYAIPLPDERTHLLVGAIRDSGDRTRRQGREDRTRQPSECCRLHFRCTSEAGFGGSSARVLST